MVMHDFNELSVFVAVVEQGGLTPVSTALGLPKSTLSRRISQLENRVGQRLLLRQSNRMLATEAGKLFYNYCRQMLDLGEQSQQALDDLKEEVSGELVLRIHNAFERGWLPPVIHSFVEEHPGIRVQVSSSLRPPSPEDAGQGDLWLWLGPETSNGLRSEPLGRWTTGLYASPAYVQANGAPEHPRQLNLHRWVDVLGGGAESVRLLHGQKGPYLFKPTPSRLKADTVVLQADALVRGQGIGILPNWYADRYEAAHPGSFVRCLDGWAPEALPVNLMYSFGRAPRKVGALIDWLRQAAPEAWRQ